MHFSRCDGICRNKQLPSTGDVHMSITVVIIIIHIYIYMIHMICIIMYAHVRYLSTSRREGSVATKTDEAQATGRLAVRLACCSLTFLSHLRITSPSPAMHACRFYHTLFCSKTSSFKADSNVHMAPLAEYLTVQQPQQTQHIMPNEDDACCYATKLAVQCSQNSSCATGYLQPDKAKLYLTCYRQLVFESSTRLEATSSHTLCKCEAAGLLYTCSATPAVNITTLGISVTSVSLVSA